MRTRLVTTLAMVACLVLVGGWALAQPRLPIFQPGEAIRASDLNRIVEQIRRNTSALDGVGGATHTVDCEAGETIANAMSQAHPGATVVISGTCEEVVVVDRDGITLDGGGTAIIDGGGADTPVIAVYGQRNVVIRGVTVQNGRHGVFADRGAAVWLEDVTAQNNGTGISIVGNSSATFAGTIIGNDSSLDGGIHVAQSTVWGENVTLLQAKRNPEGGIALHRGAQMFLASPRRIEVVENGGFTGVLCSFGSSLSVVSIHEAATDFQVSNNDGQGFWISGGAHLVLEGVALLVTDNGGRGLSVIDTSSVGAFGGYTYADVTIPAASAAFDNNGNSGVFIGGGSSANLQFGEATFTNNGGSGISVWEGSTATLSGGTINGNQGYAGLWVTRGSTVVAYNLTVENNVHRGIGVFRNSFLDLYHSLVTGGHDHSGIRVYTSRAILEGVTITDNAGDGISVSSDSHLRLRGDSSVTDNGGAGILTAPMGVSVDISDSVITGNAPDIDVSKGTHIGWVNTTVNSGGFTCDDSVVAYDDAVEMVCPE